jgi:RHS repeat-associated protein
MLRVQAEKSWSLERDLQADANLKNQPWFQEKMASANAYVMGLSYYNRVSRFEDINQRLHKVRILSSSAAGLSKVLAYRDGFGNLPNSGDIVPRQAAVDMFYTDTVLALNDTVHPDSGLPLLDSGKDFYALSIAESSAQEHAIINDFYQESAAVSTVKLLQRSAPGPVRLTKTNYATGTPSEGDKTYSYGGQNKALKIWDPSMWSAITAAFTGAGGDTAEVFITPGPVANASGAYAGLGALIFNPDAGNHAALISGNVNVSNGGFGSPFQLQVYTTEMQNISLVGDTDFHLDIRQNVTSANPAIAPTVFSLSNLNSTAVLLNSGSLVLSPTTNDQIFGNAKLIGMNTGTTAAGALLTQTRSVGTIGTQTSFRGGLVQSNMSTYAKLKAALGGFVSDPVGTVTGEFFIDAVDLALPGPMSVEIRRNYSSQSLSDNEFGQGWKLSYFPYLVVGTNDLIYAAEMDGSVIGYRKDPNNADRFVPKMEDNSSLKNLHEGGIGATGNAMNNQILRTTEGADTIYTLTGPDGQTRRFKVRQFPIGGITRSRPYLDTWTDANGNMLTFTFNNVSTDVEYGQLVQILANNGNFIGFSYDTFGHIVEAWTGDGRRLQYGYDAQGDLRAVTFPDGAVHSYDYEQETSSVAGESVQTSKHLLVKESKPDGRILVNVYDTSRRVKEQWAVVGSTPNPVKNASFEYYATQNNTAGDPNYKTWTGYTIVKDAYDRPTRYDYLNSLITSEDDPETPAEVRAWYGATETGGGAYPRSLKSITDRRGVVTFFKYDLRGNLVEKSIGTDASPADLDGDGVASAGEKAVTSWTYTPVAPFDRVETQTDAAGVVTKLFYEDSAHPYSATRLEKHVQGQLVSKTVRSFYDKAPALTSPARGLLQSEKVAEGSADEAETTWEHDNRGFVSKMTRTTGTSDPAVAVDLKHNLRGELTEETDTLGRKWKHAYDAMGRRIWSERRDAAGILLSWNYTYYNLNGDIEWTDGPRYDPEDYTWQRYDGHGRQIEQLRWRSLAKADGSGVEAASGDDLTSSTFFKYDLFGNQTDILTPRRHSVWMDYDQIGRMKERRFYEGDKNNGGVQKTSETFLYEAGGQVSRHTDVLGGVTDLYYNGRGQMRKRINPDGSVEEWRYYVDGRVAKKITLNKSCWDTTYDDLNRTITRRLKDGTGVILKTRTEKYDRRSNCIEQTIDGYTYTKTYDDLDRLKMSTGPVATATSAQRVVTYGYPDGAGREQDVVNGLNEKTVTLRDALGRVESVETRNASNAVVRKSSYAYSADQHKTTATEGTGAGAIVTESWSDTSGNLVLTRMADGSFARSTFDNGGLKMTDRDRAGRITSYSYDWRGDVAVETRPGNLQLSYGYDVAGNLLSRQMPGGMTEQRQFDSAGRVVWTKLSTVFNTTRQVNYAYYPAGHLWAGMLKSATDYRGIVSTYTYDGALRPRNISFAGSDPEDALSRSWVYNERDLPVTISEVGFGGNTQVSRAIDGYGEISSETVYAGGIVQSQLKQSFDAAGRRSKVEGAGPARDFSYRADGLLTKVTVQGRDYSASYGDHGLLLTRTNPFRAVDVLGRDQLGRVSDLQTKTGGVQVLRETVTGRNNIDQITSLSIDRTGANSWDETRHYGYDTRARLCSEDYAPAPGLVETLKSGYDGGGLGATDAASGLGVRTRLLRDSDQKLLDAVSDLAMPGVPYAPDLGPFSRVVSESLFNQVRALTLGGTALGAQKVSLTLDGRDIVPVSFPGSQDSQGLWSANVKLAAGAHVLTASATHPSGWQAPAATSSFTIAPPAETLSTIYDEMGNVATRTWSGGKSQTLTWDPRQRLVKVVETGSATPFTWTALYDGLDRRISTSYLPNGGSTVTGKSIFDPEVEFLELGLSINGKLSWKIYGPDLTGGYGALQGLGGLEAVVGADGATRGIVSDWFGNSCGKVEADGGSVAWSSAQFLAWGPAPGWGTAPLDGTKPLHELLGYRGLTVDPPGFIHMGLRDYDPSVGRWLSPDPLGHAGSLSLYDYCDNDPINLYDLDGRVGKDINRFGLAVGDRAEEMGTAFGALSVDLQVDPSGTLKKIGSNMKESFTVAQTYWGNGTVTRDFTELGNEIYQDPGKAAEYAGDAAFFALSTAATSGTTSGATALGQAAISAALKNNTIRAAALSITMATSELTPLTNSAVQAATKVPNVVAVTGRTFASADPLVEDIANTIERMYPGHVIDVNVPIRGVTGAKITDMDILLRNASIQVKSGTGAQGIAAQMAKSEAATGLPSIGYAPNIMPNAVRAISKTGALITRDKALLLEVVAP